MLRAQDVEVTSPCPIDLDETGIRGKGDSWHCRHCDKTVHVLSAMTEREAKALLAASEGQKICVSYRMSPEGEIRFRPEPAPPVVPITALRRRPAAVAAAALGVALAACAPHENPKVAPGRPDVLHQVPAVSKPAPDVIAEGEIAVPEIDVQVDGGMRAPTRAPTAPADQQIEGGMRPRPIAEPCDPPKPIPAKTLHMRGGRG